MPRFQHLLFLGDPPPFAVWNEEIISNELSEDHFEPKIHCESHRQEADVPRGSSPHKEKKRNLKKKKKRSSHYTRDQSSKPCIEEHIEVPAEAPVEEAAEEPAEEPNVAEFDGGRSDSEHSGGTEQYDSGEALSERGYRIQVSAKHLTLASPVFKKTLLGQWKESVTLLQRGSVDIPATGWDIEAFLILLRIIHCQPNDIPRELSLEMLAKVAIIADYYQCKEAMGHFLDVWIGKLSSIPANYSRDLNLWLWISWVFQLPSQFKEVTSIAMSQSPCRISSLALPIPENILDAINYGRENAIQKSILLLHKEQRTLLYNGNGCSFECRSIMYGALTLEMQSNELYSPKPEAPFPGLSYNGLVQRVLSFKSPKWYRSPSGYYNCHTCLHSSFNSLLGPLDEGIGGLDLSYYIS
ncbi:predicted protein [Histoplasma mississippiense (nom. inval.)]|uniref:predicted protein n=1 Tax=Ajellomyces capsulatus (strain NAm1 / WU24) TaxID=2059318 RepID=UPI000157CB15|nr:predicted protein [Histoplasma mississippiense (nom. inval.)]EDN09148.1 predicted protein [Histoplasma mississippiense (nom. inval.)]